MSDRILGPSGSRRRRAVGLAGGKRRRRVLLGTLASTVALVAFLVSNASAVHDLVFQLDGDVSASTTTEVPEGTTQTVDWDSIFDANGADQSPLPDDFGQTSFKRDFSATPLEAGGSFSTADSTTFTTGSKDTLDITPGWQCNRVNNVNSKIDIMNAYAVTYKDPVSGHDLIYFALERNANTGTANVGFWFLKDGTVDCTSPGGATDFDGSHQDGDLLVVSEFTSGGHVSEIKAYKWVDPDLGGPTPGSLDPNPLETGGDCEDNPDATGPDDLCATVNTDTISTPWLTANKQDGVGHSLRVSEFFEGGVDLTETGLAGACFNTFIADTRSSTSLTATLFDYARDRLGQCEATMTTQVKTSPAPGTNVLPTVPINPGTPVHDLATVTGNKPVTPTGTVTFFLCSFATGSTDVCDGTTGKVGMSIGTGTLSGSGSTATAISPDVNTATSPLGPGRYCFRAEWPGDTNYTTPLKEFSGLTECFTVKSVSSISTTQKWLPQDTATVLIDGVPATTGSGSVTFSLYENTDTCVGTAATTFTDNTVGTGGTFETNNNTYYTASKVISWSAVFNPTDSNAVAGSTTTSCEGSSVTINNNSGPFPPVP